MTDRPSAAPTQTISPRFGALSHPGFRAFFITSSLAMMGDNIEHVLSYWVLHETFHSPLIGGYAVISHWAPFIFLAFYSGALADRFDCRRLIQGSAAMFALASLGWGIIFFTQTAQVWHAVVLLTLHGLAAVLWGPAGQLILHDMVGPAHLPSAVRLNATGRQLGVLLGPAVGGVLLLVFGPALGLLVNCLAYLPLFLWLFVTPYTGHRSEGQPSRAGVGLKDLVDVLRQVSSNRTVLSMIALTGLASLFVGNAMQAQMPEFAHDLSHHHGSDERAGAGYTALQTAQAAGAVFGGFALEVTRMVPTSPRTAIVAGALFGVAVAAFAGSTNYWLALALLFAVGMLRLTYGSMAQALVQIHAPQALRGRVLGVFSIAQNGLQAGSGFTVGVMGTMVGVHWSTAASAIILVASVAALYLLLFGPRRGTSGAD